MNNNNIKTILDCELFQSFNENEIVPLMHCLNASKRSVVKDEILYYENDSMHFLGIVLSGKLNIVKYDFFGNKNIIVSILPSEMFGESLVSSDNPKIPFSLEAECDSEILMIPYEKVLSPCSEKCSFHIMLIKNMVKALSDKVQKLTKKINILSQRTTKEKILSLLNTESQFQKSKTIDIKMTRQEMADFFSVDRSALSRELNLLKNEKIIDFRKNIFKIL